MQLPPNFNPLATSGLPTPPWAQMPPTMPQMPFQGPFQMPGMVSPIGLPIQGPHFGAGPMQFGVGAPASPAPLTLPPTTPNKHGSGPTNMGAGVGGILGALIAKMTGQPNPLLPPTNPMGVNTVTGI